jgi:glycerol uptake facilitator-like aquaporin
MHPVRAIGYMLAQFSGAVVGALLIWGSVSTDGNNEVMKAVLNKPAVGVTIGQAFLIETVLTYLLILVVLETAVNKVCDHRFNMLENKCGESSSCRNRLGSLSCSYRRHTVYWLWNQPCAIFCILNSLLMIRGQQQSVVTLHISVC